MTELTIRKMIGNRQVRYQNTFGIEIDTVYHSVTEYVLCSGELNYLVWVEGNRHQDTQCPLFVDTFPIGDDENDPLFRGKEAAEARKRVEIEFRKQYEGK